MVKLAFRIDVSGVPSTFRPTGSTIVARIQELESRHINPGVCPGSLGFFSTFGTRSDVFDLRSIAGSIFRWAALGCHVRIIIPAHDGPGGVPVSTFEKVVGGKMKEAVAATALSRISQLVTACVRGFGRGYQSMWSHSGV